MLEKIKRYKQTIFITLIIVHLISLVFLSNDWNSKIILLLFSFSLLVYENKFVSIWNHHYPIIIYFFLVCVSLLYSSNLEMGLKKISRLMILPVSIIVFTSLPVKRGNIIFILKAFIAIMFLATMTSYFKMAKKFIQNDESHIRNFFNLNYSYTALGETLDLHTTYYSLFLILSIIALCWFISIYQSSFKRAWLIVLISYFTFFIIQLSSRTSIITVYLILLSNLIFHTKRNLFRTLISIVIFHFFVFSVVNIIGTTKYRFKHVFGFQYYTGYIVNDGNHKINLWKSALDANDNLLYGVGIGDIQDALNKSYKNNGLTKPFKENYNSHNQYIENFVGYGVVGLALFIFLLGYYLKFFLKQKSILGIFFTVSIIIVSTTECLWNRHMGIVFICTFLLLLYQYTLRESKTLPSQETI